MSSQYQVIVVGAGHAGCEAALASARLGLNTALITMDKTAIARMSCNPSIGGIAKSHIVFELDALGGEMARNADYTGIQFRILNTRKGPAVRANRAQCDKVAYSARMTAILQMEHNLEILEAEVTGIWLEKCVTKGVILANNEKMAGQAVVITAGTFLKGTIHVGMESRPGGRDGEKASIPLSESLRTIGLRLGRLKTGTPPRLKAESIDWEKMEPQPGLQPIPFFSCKARKEARMFHVEQNGGSSMFHVEHAVSPVFPWPLNAPQIPCFLTHTTAETHAIIRDNLHQSALYGGRISGTGVRYCPSVEDKIVKFPDKSCHHVFIEPEGRHSTSIYPNGISNSLPIDIQEQLVHSIPGLQRAEFLHPAYAIEYDYSDPTQLSHSLECRDIPGLFMAGQVNGTTGYEEAAGQGFLAGINAAFKVLGREPFILGRNEAYLGVMIDDLVIRGVDEPYRMFTSRAEFRLSLRQDNARFRLHDRAHQLGIVSTDQLQDTDMMIAQIKDEMKRLSLIRHSQVTQAQYIKRPDVGYLDLPGALVDMPLEVIEQIEILAKYEGYIQMEAKQMERLREMEDQRLPAGLDYGSIASMRYESRQRLNRIRPRTLGQAMRIPGVNPVDITLIAIELKRRSVGALRPT